MGTTIGYLTLSSTANVLDIPENEVLGMEANGEIGFQLNGNVKEYTLNFDSERKPQYIPISCNDGYWLDVMYPSTLAEELKGYFPLYKPFNSADYRDEPMRFLSSDEREFSRSVPSILMQSDFYFFKRLDKADESFQDACEQLHSWTNSHKGSEYLVMLKKGSLKDRVNGELVHHHKGKFGETL
jgi:hypothetical protein